MLLNITFLYTVAEAQEQVVEATGSYIIGDGPEENVNIAKERARIKALRTAAEYAGVYIESCSIAIDNRLAHDEIIVIASQIMKILEDKIAPEVVGETVKYTCHIKAVVDTDNINFEKILSGKKAIEENIKLHKQIETLQAEVIELKNAYKTSNTTEEKEAIDSSIKKNENSVNNAYFKLPLYSNTDKKWSVGISADSIKYYESDGLVEYRTDEYNNESGIATKTWYLIHINNNTVSVKDCIANVNMAHGKNPMRPKFDNSEYDIGINSNEEKIQKKIYDYLGIKSTYVNKKPNWKFVYHNDEKNRDYYVDTKNVKYKNGYTAIATANTVSGTNKEKVGWYLYVDFDNDKIGFEEYGQVKIYPLDNLHIYKDTLEGYIPVYFYVKNNMIDLFGSTI